MKRRRRSRKHRLFQAVEVLEDRRVLDSTVVLNEVMYHPAEPHPTAEWLELHNQMAVDMDLSGWSFEGIEFQFPDDTILAGGDYLVVAKDPTLFAERGFADTANVLGPFGGRLSNSGETLIVRNAGGRTMDTLNFGDREPWPAAADGTGHSLAKIDPQSATGEATHWTQSQQRGGTPGFENFPVLDPAPTTTTLVARDASWRYRAAADEVDPDWPQPEFDAADWSRGDAVLFAGSFPSIPPPDTGASQSGSAIEIANPSFEVNRHGNDGHGNITGWSTLGSVGINPTITATTPFADNGLIPDHRQAAFIEGRGSLTQVLQGLTVGQQYWLELHYNASDCCRAQPAITISLNNEVLLPPTDVEPVGEDQAYHTAVMPFTATSEDSPLVIRNVSSRGDSILLLDAVSLIARDSDQIPVHNASFESLGRTAPGPVAHNRLAGWQASGEAAVGAVPASAPTLSEVVVPDGLVVASIEGTGTLGQRIENLEPGQRYELQFAAGSLPDPTATQASLVARLDDATVVTSDPPAVPDPFAIYSYRFVATQSHVDVSFEQTAADATLLLDNVMIRQVNSPLVTTLDAASTTYFRHEFTYTGIPSQTRLDLGMFLDDSAQVFLNGQEVHRFNLPAGAIADETYAIDEVDEPVWRDPVAIDHSSLTVGRNLLAVAVHPSGDADNDLAIAMELTARETPLKPAEPSLPVAINELTALGGDSFTVELFNFGQRPIDLDRLELTVGGQQVSLPDEAIPARGARAIVTSEPINQDDLVVLANRVANRVLDARHVSDSAIARHPDGVGPFYHVSATTPGAQNDVQLESSIVINEIMYHAPPTYPDSGTAPRLAHETIVPLDAMWRYNDSGVALPGDWHQSRHEVGGQWNQGRGLLGFERSRLIEPGINTPMNEDVLTYYLESDFDLTGAMLADTDLFQLRHVVDDGAVVYVNGVEVLRFHMPEGPVDSQTEATRSVNNATLSEAVDIPKQLLKAGTNRISVQLHQTSASSSDAVFGAELLSGRIVDPGVPPTPYAENDQEWIELYNRGSAAVDISNWSLDDAVRFRFPEGTLLPPGDYLVVARDAALLSTQHPEIRVVGSFSGQLSNSNERILLKDSLGNPVDQVRYYDGGRWHDLADGNGSSLELRDARADNQVAENWQASISGESTDWRTYSYRARGDEPRNLNAPNGFHELILGLLDSGRILLDDIRLIEDPDGAARNLIQNGTFESDSLGSAPEAWRWVGNHETTVVVSDPETPGNKVLLLEASGPTEHMSNHGETTFAGGATVDEDSTYELSFRAKWLSGSPRLNSRLYFGHAAKTVNVDISSLFGTPGTVNSRAVDNAGPSFYDLRHEPLVPGEDVPVTVSVQVADPDGVQSLTLNYSADDAEFVATPMVSVGDGLYEGTIPGHAENEVVQFYVTASDQRGAVAQYPASGPESRAAYRVDTELDADKVHSLRVIMTRPDVSKLHTNANVMSNRRLGATVIYNDREVFYDVGIRLRASGYGRQGPLAGFNIQFDPQQLFRGVHNTIALDRGAVFSNGNGTGGVRGQPGASPHELLIYQIAHRAGGIGAMYDDVVYVDAPRSANTGFALLKMARYSDLYLDSQFEDGSEGSLFKYELIYHATTTVDGRPESLKRAPNSVVATEITDLGDDAEGYRYNFVLKNERDRDDFGELIQLGKTFSLRRAELETAAPQIMDVDQWTRTFALHSLVGTADTYNMGLAHNLELYVRPSDNRVLALPWDVDHGFFYSTRNNILGVGGSNFDRVVDRPQYRRLFYKHLQDIIQHAYNEETVRPWADHYTEITGLGSAEFFTNYVTNRSSFVLDRLNAVAPQIDFQITTNQGQPLTIETPAVTLTGQGWIDVDSVARLQSEEPVELHWLDETRWQIELPVRPGENSIELQAYDLRGNIVGTDAIQVTSQAALSPVQEFLRVTELMYNPPPPSATELAINPDWENESFEFLELANVSSEVTLPLEGVQWFDGPAEPLVLDAFSLAPGQRAVIVGDKEAFQARYGQAVTVIGQFAGNLSNGGERLRLNDAQGRPVIDFTFSDDPPWPQAADGQGPSLELINPRTPVQFLGSADRWQISAAVGGTPGEPPRPAGDLNGDGIIDAIDIDRLCRAMPDELQFDLNQDRRVNEADLDHLVTGILGTNMGDANLDGVFDSRDLVQIFQAGQYEDDIAGNSHWQTGDWNCDGEFNTRDLVKAFQAGGYRA